jgi:hypothetical protein
MYNLGIWVGSTDVGVMEMLAGLIKIKMWVDSRHVKSLFCGINHMSISH